MTNKKEMEKAELGIQDLWPIALIVIVVGIGAAYGLEIISDVQSGFTTNSAEYNATASAVTGVSNLTGKLPTIATIVAAAVIIGVLVRNFMSGR